MNTVDGEGGYLDLLKLHKYTRNGVFLVGIFIYIVVEIYLIFGAWHNQIRTSLNTQFTG